MNETTNIFDVAYGEKVAAKPTEETKKPREGKKTEKKPGLLESEKPEEKAATEEVKTFANGSEITLSKKPTDDPLKSLTKEADTRATSEPSSSPSEPSSSRLPLQAVFDLITSLEVRVSALEEKRRTPLNDVSAVAPTNDELLERVYKNLSETFAIHKQPLKQVTVLACVQFDAKRFGLAKPHELLKKLLSTGRIVSERTVTGSFLYMPADQYEQMIETGEANPEWAVSVGLRRRK